MQEEDLGGLAAMMAFYFMMALFPTLILLVWVLDFLPLPGDMPKVVGRAFTEVSPQLGEIVQGYVEQFARRRPSGSLLLWIFAALWAASRGIGGARKGLDKVFRAERRRNFAKLKLVDLGLTLSGIIVVGVANVILIGGEQFLRFAASNLGMEKSQAVLWTMLRWPIVLALLLSAVVALYRVLPARKLPARYLWLGAIPTVFGWLALGSGFRLWLRSMGSFDKIYGSLASVFLMMFFLWLLSMCLLIGGQTAYVTAHDEGEDGQLDADADELEDAESSAGATLAEHETPPNG